MGSDSFISLLSCPSALVGECPVADVQMGGVTVTCLIDTGSMVSTITESFFNDHFRVLGCDQLRSCGWLQLKAANGLDIPYRGYLELDVEVLGKVLPSIGVLVVQDPPDSRLKTNKDSVPGLIGMNVLRCCLQEFFCQDGASLFTSWVNSPSHLGTCLISVSTLRGLFYVWCSRQGFDCPWVLYLCSSWIFKVCVSHL